MWCTAAPDPFICQIQSKLVSVFTLPGPMMTFFTHTIPQCEGTVYRSLSQIVLYLCGALIQDTYWICSCSSVAAQWPKVQVWFYWTMCEGIQWNLFNRRKNRTKSIWHVYGFNPIQMCYNTEHNLRERQSPCVVHVKANNVLYSIQNQKIGYTKNGASVSTHFLYCMWAPSNEWIGHNGSSNIP